MQFVAQLLISLIALAVGGGMTLTGAMAVAESAFEDDAELRRFGLLAGWIIGTIGICVFIAAAAAAAMVALS